MAPLRLHIDGRTFRDQNNRQVTLRGINVAGDAKFPTRPNLPSHLKDDFFKGDEVSFTDRPFSVSDAPIHFARLRRWGFDTIRYIFTWEAIEAAGPGKYDESWIQHTISVLRVAKEYGFYVFMDPHQDVWSRFSGGSGAPMWTLYACGLNPRTFAATEAAIVHNTYEDPAQFPKMIWATNYTRLACQVMFTLFWAGRTFAPLAVLDGKNIQDYLQDHFIAACRHVAKRIDEAGGLYGETVVGWESLNEPNRGLIGWQDMAAVPAEQKLQKGTSPTAWQATLLGSGRACEVETWDIGQMGPYRAGSQLVDPQGVKAWLPEDYGDDRYGWKRDPSWKLGQCLWAQLGIWDPDSDTLLRKDYFAKMPDSGDVITYEYFTNHFFMAHYRKYRDMVRSVFPKAIMFCQPPVLEIPPTIKGTEDDDPNMVFAPHFYDGLTLMNKKWNRFWNVDVFGVLRGKYWTPALAIRIGETAIRNCFKDQLAAIQAEGLENMGEHPCFFTEIGIPFDMDDKYAYRTGDYSSQVAALDANHFALEGSLAAGYTLWCYTTINNHQWGDNWNGEDLSIYSCDDPPLPAIPSAPGADSAFPASDPSSPSYSRSRSSEMQRSVTPSTLRSTLTQTEAMSTSKLSPTQSSTHQQASLSSSGATNPKSSSYHTANDTALSESLGKPPPSFRAAAAYVRPYPVTTHGTVISYGFDLRACTFTLSLQAPSSTPETSPTEIALPELHFPVGHVAVDVTGGKWDIRTTDVDEGKNPIFNNSDSDDQGADLDRCAPIQKLRWWHAEGEQKIVITGVKSAIWTADDDGYWNQCPAPAPSWGPGLNCTVM